VEAFWIGTNISFMCHALQLDVSDFYISNEECSEIIMRRTYCNSYNSVTNSLFGCQKLRKYDFSSDCQAWGRMMSVIGQLTANWDWGFPPLVSYFSLATAHVQVGGRTNARCSYWREFWTGLSSQISRVSRVWLIIVAAQSWVSAFWIS
jgi:hypothetical protein